MRFFIRFFALVALVLPMSARADVAPLAEHVLGKADAPVRIDEYVSLTCSHCADFYNNVLPEIEKRYVETGKVKIVFHNFVLDGAGLRAAQIAECMPGEQFFPFVKLLYANQKNWAMDAAPEKILVSYARLGGLTEDKAQACLKDTKLQDAIVAERETSAIQKNKIEATPSFVFSDGVEVMRGAGSVADFAKIIDRLLLTKH
jgi:protein-disulfide isomerase